MSSPAIAIAPSIMSPISTSPPSQQKTGNLGGRPVTAIISYALLGFATLGVIVAIAAWILGFKEVFAVSLILAVSNGIGFYGIKIAEPEKKLEDNVKEMKVEAIELREERINADNSTLRYHQTNVEYETTIKKLVAELGEKANEIQKLMESGKQIQSKYDEMVKVCESMQKAVASFVQTSTSLTGIANNERTAFQQLSEQLQKSNTADTLIAGEQKNFTASLESFNNSVAQITIIFQTFDRELKSMQDLNESLSKNITDLRSNTTTLQTTLNSMQEKIKLEQEFNLNAGALLQGLPKLDDLKKLIEKKSAEKNKTETGHQ